MQGYCIVVVLFPGCPLVLLHIASIYFDTRVISIRTENGGMQESSWVDPNVEGLAGFRYDISDLFVTF